MSIVMIEWDALLSVLPPRVPALSQVNDDVRRGYMH